MLSVHGFHVHDIEEIDFIYSLSFFEENAWHQLRHVRFNLAHKPKQATNNNLSGPFAPDILYRS